VRVFNQQPSNIFAPALPNAAFPNPALQQSTSQTINYVYDPLQRLTQANYSNGDYYHYTYDAVGNRLTQNKSIIGLVTTDTSVYDNANRVQSVNGVTYTFDANGNLLNDGVTAYAYDSANRLKTLTGASTTASYSYNGLGDRLRETTNGVTTTFTMDYNTGLTQALSDGTKNYIYGNGRIAQAEYFLGDALGSVRQLTNASGAITYTKAYDPYGVVTSTSGASQSAYGYTGEQQDASGLTYLRSRYYASGTGRFLTRDTWGGDANSPLSFNRWNYVEGNPVNRLDPSGYCYLDDLSEVCVPYNPQLNNGIRFSGNWSEPTIRAVYDAVTAVGVAINRTIGLQSDPLRSFAKVFRTERTPILFFMG